MSWILPLLAVYLLLGLRSGRGRARIPWAAAGVTAAALAIVYVNLGKV